MHELTLISVHPLFDLISVNSYELALEVISDAAHEVAVFHFSAAENISS